MPKVSVIIPAYNRAHFIAETIQSVLDQTFEDYEVIVVDDGSTDNTREVVDSFKDHRIKYIYEENRGASGARNTGIKASSGEYIAFLDADDVLLEETFRKGVQVLDRHPEVAFSYGQKYLMDERGCVFKLRKPKHRNSGVLSGTTEITHYLIYGNPFSTMTVMARRRCLIEVGLFNPTFRCSGDVDLWIRLAKKNAVAYIAEPLTKKRIHSNRITAERDSDDFRKANSRILEGIFNDAELGPLFSSKRSESYYHLYLITAGIAYAEGNMKLARKHLFRALKIYPGGFFKSLGLPWILLITKICLPLRILSSYRKGKRYLSMLLWRRV